MALVRWNPIGELASMEIDRLNRMFSNLYGEGLTRNFEGLSRSWVPSADIYETEHHEIVIKVELPGMNREDISVTFEGGVLTLTGERRPENEIANDRYQRRERFSGSFSRSFTLPATIDASHVSAAYKDGVLTIRLPQREEAKPKQIVVGD
jgi:HSP20 family protein